MIVRAFLCDTGPLRKEFLRALPSLANETSNLFKLFPCFSPKSYLLILLGILNHNDVAKMAFVNDSERLIALLPKLDDFRDLNDVLKSEGIDTLATLSVERLVKILFGLDCFDLGVLLKDDENEAGAFLSNHSERLVRILSNLRLPDLRVLLKAEKHHSCPSARNEIGNVAPFPLPWNPHCENDACQIRLGSGQDSVPFMCHR